MKGRALRPRSGLVQRSASLLLVLGCTSHYRPYVKPNEAQAKRAASLEKIRWYLDAYGEGSLSTPILVQPDDAFKFNLTQVTPDTLFTAAKTEIVGRGATSVSSASDFGFGLSGSVDVTQVQQYAAAVAAYQAAQNENTRRLRILDQTAQENYRLAVATAQQI
jgi:hypothetical protein